MSETVSIKSTFKFDEFFIKALDLMIEDGLIKEYYYGEGTLYGNSKKTGLVVDFGHSRPVIFDKENNKIWYDDMDSNQVNRIIHRIKSYRNAIPIIENYQANGYDVNFQYNEDNESLELSIVG